MAQSTRSLRQQAQQEFAQSLDRLGADFDFGDGLFGDDLGAELAQLPEVVLDEFPVAPLPKKSALPLVPDAVPPTMER